MSITAINGSLSQTATKFVKPTKILNRATLNTTNSQLKSLDGPKELRKAKWWVAAYTAENALLGVATAQTGPLGSVVLSTVEMSMAMHIFQGIYNFKFSESVIKALLAGCTGAYVGTKTIDMATKSILAFFPGIGNALNAGVSGSVTAALGASLIATAESLDKARKRGEDMDKFIKLMTKAAEEDKKNKKK